MFEGIFVDLVKAIDGVTGKVGATVSATVVALSFMMSVIRVAYQAYEKGLDQWSVYAKKQVGVFLVVVGLCIQLPFPPYDGSFITSFPSMIIREGFKSVEPAFKESGLSAENYSESIINKLRQGKESKMPAASEKILKELKKQLPDLMLLIAKAGTSFIPTLGPMLMSVKALVVAGALFLPFIPMMFPLFLVNAAFAGIMLFLSFFVCLVTAGAFVLPPGSDDLKTAMVMFESIRIFVKGAMSELGLFMFVTALTFGFMGTMLSLIIKSVVFCATFPIAVVNMAFEKQQQVFIQNVVRIFSIAITPFIMGIVFQVLMAAYGTICQENGVFDRVVESYLWSNLNAANLQGDILGACMEMYGFLFRFFVAAFAVPAMLVTPAVVMLVKSGSVAEGLLGHGIGFLSVGMSQKWMGVGGAGRFMR